MALDMYHTEQEEENCIRRECCYGSFSGTAMLPDGVDADRTQASLEDGMLTPTIPKASEAEAKVIGVNGDKK
jgi:HSP20 family protein